MKKVLIIAYYFPPALSGGVFRPAKLVKYLKHFGWDISVLAARSLPHVHTDADLLRDIPFDVKVYRCFSFHPQYIKKILRRLLKSRKRDPIGNAEEQASINKKNKGNQKKTKKNNYRQTFIKWSKKFLIPDESVLWLPFAFICSVRILRKHKINLIL